MKIIYGAGEEGRIVLDILRQNNITEIMFVDNNKDLHGKEVEGIKVAGEKSIKKDTEVIIALGDNKTRCLRANRVEELGAKLFTAIHPNAVISERTEIGKNVIINAGAIVNTGSKISDSVIINTNAIVEHDNIIEEGAHIAPGVNLAGGVHVKKQALIGIGATVMEDLTIGENSIVGAGAVVLEDVPDNTIVAGIPAKVIRKIKLI